VPAPSVYIRKLRASGIREGRFTREWSAKIHVERVARYGKRVEMLLSEVSGATELTRTLLGVRLPNPESTLTSRRLRCSNFVRFILRREKETWPVSRGRDLLAVVHAEYVLEAPSDYEPHRSASMYEQAPDRSEPHMLLTGRLLDVHVQPGIDSERGAIVTEAGRVLAEQMARHAACAASVLDNGDDLYERPTLVLQYRFQGRLGIPLEGAIVRAGIVRFRHAPIEWQDGSICDTRASACAADADARFEDAIIACRSPARMCAHK